MCMHSIRGHQLQSAQRVVYLLSTLSPICSRHISMLLHTCSAVDTQFGLLCCCAAAVIAAVVAALLWRRRRKRRAASVGKVSGSSRHAAASTDLEKGTS
jgi:hypothetical protein